MPFIGSIHFPSNVLHLGRTAFIARFHDDSARVLPERLQAQRVTDPQAEAEEVEAANMTIAFKSQTLSTLFNIKDSALGLS